MMKLTLLLLLILSNLAWWAGYRRLDAEEKQGYALLQWSNDLLKQQPDRFVYQINRTESGELSVHCLNGADATMRPVSEFGWFIVSCGK